MMACPTAFRKKTSKNQYSWSCCSKGKLKWETEPQTGALGGAPDCALLGSTALGGGGGGGKGVSQGKAEQEKREKKEKNKLRNQRCAWSQSHTEKRMQGSNWTLGHGVGKGTEIRSITLSRGRGPGGVPGHSKFPPRRWLLSLGWGSRDSRGKAAGRERGAIQRGCVKAQKRGRREYEDIGQRCTAVWGWQGRAGGMQAAAVAGD